ncbi:hypothetical protein [Ferruginibacter sp.]|nr:hypothetical protein [Ferruginibacter sp.]
MNTFFINHVKAAPAASSKANVEILVFKTNLTDAKRIEDVESLLDIHPHIIQWNVDLNDCDNVLRIVSRNIAAQEVENILLNAGYYCEELQ